MMVLFITDNRHLSLQLFPNHFMIIITRTKKLKSFKFLFLTRKPSLFYGMKITSDLFDFLITEKCFLKLKSEM